MDPSAGHSIGTMLLLSLVSLACDGDQSTSTEGPSSTSSASGTMTTTLGGSSTGAVMPTSGSQTGGPPRSTSDGISSSTGGESTGSTRASSSDSTEGSSSDSTGESSSDSTGGGSSDSTGGSSSDSTPVEELDPNGCDWSHTLPEFEPRFLESVGDGLVVAAGQQGSSIVLVGLDPEGDELFSHQFENLGPNYTEMEYLSGVTVRGEDELLVVAGTNVYSFVPSTGDLVDLALPHLIVHDDPAAVIDSLAFERVAVSPAGHILVQSREIGFGDRMFVQRYDFPQTDPVWSASSDTGFWGPTIEGFLADDGPFGVLLGETSHPQGEATGVNVRRYGLATGTGSSLFSQWQGHDNGGYYYRYLGCMEFLEDGTLMAATSVWNAFAPHDSWTEVQRWSSEGELLSMSLTGLGHCGAVATPAGGAYIVARASATEFRIARVSPQGDVEIVVDALPGEFVDIVHGDDNSVTVLRTSALGVPSARKHCFD